MLGIDKFVVCRSAEVFDVVNQEKIRGSMVGKQNNLGATLGKGAGNCSTNA